MSAPSPGRDCKERIDELMNAARTMPDEHLISGMCNPGFQKKHARLEIPLVGIGQVFHEDATSGFSNYSPVKYQATIQRAFYPSGQDANLYDADGITVLNVTAGAPDDTWRPVVGIIYEVQGMYLQISATAAGREADVNLFDGVRQVPVWQSGAAGIATGDAYAIYPVDQAGLMPIALIGNPPLKITNGTYLQLDTTGLAAAETIALTIAYIARYVGGLD